MPISEAWYMSCDECGEAAPVSCGTKEDARDVARGINWHVTARAAFCPNHIPARHGGPREVWYIYE